MATVEMVPLVVGRLLQLRRVREGIGYINSWGNGSRLPLPGEQQLVVPGYIIQESLARLVIG